MLDQTRSAGKMVKMFQDNPSLMEQLKTEPEKALNDVAKNIIQETWTGDKMLYRIAVIVLGALALIAALGSIGMYSTRKNQLQPLRYLSRSDQLQLER